MVSIIHLLTKPLTLQVLRGDCSSGLEAWSLGLPTSTLFFSWREQESITENYTMAAFGMHAIIPARPGSFTRSG